MIRPYLPLSIHYSIIDSANKYYSSIYDLLGLFRALEDRTNKVSVLPVYVLVGEDGD